MIRLHDDEPRRLAAQPSRHAAEHHLRDLREVIEAIRKGSKPRGESRAWPVGLDRSILRALPLRVRTRNGLKSAHLMEGDGPLTVKRLLSIPNFGRKSLKDLIFKVEDFLSQCVRNGSTDPNEAGEPNERAPTCPEGTIAPSARTEAPRPPWDRVERILVPPLAVAVELHEARTLADVLSPEFMRLAGRMGIADEIDMIGIGDVTRGASGFIATALSRLSLTLDAASANEHIIIEQRLLRTPRATLDKIGSQAGVTRERIRQLQANIERKVRGALGKEGRVAASVLKEQFGSVVPRSEVDRRIEEIIPADQGLATRLIRKTLVDDMGFTLDDGMYLDEAATEQLKEIRASIHGLADDVGLVDERQVIACLPDEWRRFWPWVRQHCGLHEMFGSIAIRDSGKARAKAALISIGRPATRAEVARVCGFEEDKTASHLSVIPSVVKADKSRWALDDWVDDAYEGIVGEIIQRIEEDGGATTTERLLTEMSGKFGVNPVSVRTYMQTSKFVIRDGWISLAHPSSIQLRDLDDVIDGRDRGGAPYWTFVVEDRFFDGYSVTGVPPEFAKALGCAPDAGERVRIGNLPDCPELSIRWPLASTTGASLGYLAEPLEHLGLEPRQRVRVTIKGHCLVDLNAHDRSAAETRTSGADAILKRMMQRRRLP